MIQQSRSSCRSLGGSVQRCLRIRNTIKQCIRYSNASSTSTTNEYSSINSTTTGPKLLSILDNPDLLDHIPLEDVRNFCFMAHVDHGKSSLSSRILELSGNLGRERQKIAFEHIHQTYKGSEAEAHGQLLDPTNEGTTSSSSPTTTTNDIIDDSIRPMNMSSASGNREEIELLDTLAVEQERGITVKATTATMLYSHPAAIGPKGVLLINMYDTPGHVDFGREVSRSLSFVQGAVLLLDATQGIQAQTWSVVEKAKALPKPPTLLIALTKVDLPMARPIDVAITVSEWLHWDDPDDIMLTSARSRIGIKTVLDRICERVPSPKALADDDGDEEKSFLRAQVIDSWYDSRGVNCLVQIVSGCLTENDRISIVSTDEGTGNQSQSYSVQEVGILLPKNHRTGKLRRGQMGYVRFGLKDPRQALPGTVLIWHSSAGQKNMILPEMPRGIENKSVMYASVHPEDVGSFDELCNAIERLALNDTGLEVQRTASLGSETGGPFLGPGLRVGFQGLLHAEVFRQRLENEFNIEAIVTPPKVPYTITYMPNKKNHIKEKITKVVEDLAEWVSLRAFLCARSYYFCIWDAVSHCPKFQPAQPQPGTKYKILEPIVEARIIARVQDTGAVMDLITRKRGTDLKSKPLDEEKWLFTARIPWGEMVTDFHDHLKNVTAGYGSLDTCEADPPLAEAHLSKVDLYLNDEVVAPLAFVSHKDVAHGEAKAVCKKVSSCVKI